MGGGLRWKDVWRVCCECNAWLPNPMNALVESESEGHQFGLSIAYQCISERGLIKKSSFNFCHWNIITRYTEPRYKKTHFQGNVHWLGTGMFTEKIAMKSQLSTLLDYATHCRIIEGDWVTWMQSSPPMGCTIVLDVWNAIHVTRQQTLTCWN